MCLIITLHIKFNFLAISQKYLALFQNNDLFCSYTYLCDYVIHDDFYKLVISMTTKLYLFLTLSVLDNKCAWDIYCFRSLYIRYFPDTEIKPLLTFGPWPSYIMFLKQKSPYADDFFKFDTFDQCLGFHCLKTLKYF